MNIDKHKSESLQEQLRAQFLEAFELLNNADRGKEAESHLTFCLYRLEPHDKTRKHGVPLLSKGFSSEAAVSFSNMTTLKIEGEMPTRE